MSQKERARLLYMKDKQSNEILVTLQLYEKVGMKKIGDAIKYYQLKELDCAEKYVYRLPFAWELKNWKEVESKYVLSEISEEGYFR